MQPVFVIGVDIYSLILTTVISIVFLLCIPAIYEEMVFRIKPKTTKLFFLEQGRLLNTKLYFKPIENTITIKSNGKNRSWEVSESLKEKFYWLNGKRRALLLPHDSASALSLYEPESLLSPEVYGNCISLARQEGMLIHSHEENQIKKVVMLVTITLIASVVILALELFKMSKG